MSPVLAKEFAKKPAYDDLTIIWLNYEMLIHKKTNQHSDKAQGTIRYRYNKVQYKIRYNYDRKKFVKGFVNNIHYLPSEPFFQNFFWHNLHFGKTKLRCR